MNIGSLNSLSHHPIRWTAILMCVYLLVALVPTARAENGSDSADGMLENLKRRSADERWQRIKSLYPADPPAPRRKMPARLPANHQDAVTSSEIPPSPAQTKLIPRLSALPVDNSNDWILPARQPDVDMKEANTESGTTAVQSTEGNVSDGSSTRAAEKVATQDIEVKAAPVDSNSNAASRTLHERTITEISPFYDRDRDSDIRRFAVEKGKELDIQFKPKTYDERSFPEVNLPWEATNFYFYPLYFSDPALERYGHTYHPVIQPIASIARVGAQFVLLPYQMTINPICKKEYPVGYYRPGDCAPKLHYQLPLNAEAALVEAGAITGLYFIIP